MKIITGTLACFLLLTGCTQPRTVVKDGVVYEEKTPGYWSAKGSTRRQNQNNRALRYIEATDNAPE